MASKTLVAGNRVTIDDSGYDVKPAGPSKYAVFDEFGGKIGTFTVRGKAVDPEDYGVAGAHPVVQIGKLWVAANLAKPDEKGGPASKVVCRVAVHERPGAEELARAKAYHGWLAKVPGVKAVHFAHDPATGKAMSISVWETREHLAALKEQAPPEGAAPLKAVSVEVLPIVEA